ncbi:MAG: tetratricopeptide repeat protein [Candidatus Electrothrix sp. MAN1_4]|nr:tetratricopeptide repeat protein [Candidatus Electrothrix sp. MAN1_4]
MLLRRSVAQVSDDARLALSLAGTLAFAPITRDTVAAILKGDENRARDALNELVNYGLNQLVDYSLLEKREERWQVSHALIHTYARTELTLSKESLERLTAYYIDFCKIQGKAGLKGYARLDEERAHCLRLIEICLDRGLWQEVKGLGGAMWEYLDRQGYWSEQLTAVDMRLTAAQHASDRNDECWCLNSFGYTCQRRGDNEQALAWYEQTLPIRCELGDRRGEGVTLNNMAAIYDDQGKHELALDTYQQSLSIQQEIGDREGEGTTLNNIGELYRIQGDYEQAMLFFEQSLSIRREVDDRTGEGTNLNNIALIYDIQGKPSKAIEYYEQALIIAQELGDRAGEAVNCWNLGFTYEEVDDLAQAEEYISQAVQIAEQIGHPYLEQFRDGLARVRAARQGTQEA